MIITSVISSTGLRTLLVSSQRSALAKRSINFFFNTSVINGCEEWDVTVANIPGAYLSQRRHGQGRAHEDVRTTHRDGGQTRFGIYEVHCSGKGRCCAVRASPQSHLRMSKECCFIISHTADYL